MNRLVITLTAAMILAAGTLCAAEPAKKAPAKCPCTGKKVCTCDAKKNCKCSGKKQTAPANQNQNIINRATNKVLNQQKKNDQRVIDQGLL